MTAEMFRQLALGFPEAVESAHMGHPDFRVGGKIFATIRVVDDEELGMLKLKPEQQRIVVNAEPDAYSPVSGGWGRLGATNVHFKKAKKASVKNALALAWCNTAPKKLVEKYEGGE